MFNVNGQGAYHSFGGTHIHPVSSWTRVEARRRADGINFTNTLTGAWTIRNGLATAGGDTILRYFDYDGVDDYIGPVSAGHMVWDGYGAVTNYDQTGLVVSLNQAIGVWVYNTSIDTEIPVLGLGHAGHNGLGIWWECGATSGRLSAVSSNTEYQSIVVDRLGKDKWVFIVLDFNSREISVNGEPLLFRNSFAIDPDAFDITGSLVTDTWYGEVPDSIIGAAGYGSVDRYGTGNHYIEIGRNMGPTITSGQRTTYDGQDWPNSFYNYAPNSFYVGEVAVWGKPPGHVDHGDGFGKTPAAGSTGLPSVHRYWYNVTLSAGQEGYYHAQDL